jgi:hypothetical protein
MKHEYHYGRMACQNPSVGGKIVGPPDPTAADWAWFIALELLYATLFASAFAFVFAAV